MERKKKPVELCTCCRKPVIMIYQGGTGYCSQMCEKGRCSHEDMERKNAKEV